MQDYLVDTDVIIDILRQQSHALRFIETPSVFWYISVITITEIYAGTRSVKEEKDFDELLQAFEILLVTQNIACMAGKLKNTFAKSHKLGIADTLIAATAKEHNLLLQTLNTKHYPMFEKIQAPYIK